MMEVCAWHHYLIAMLLLAFAVATIIAGIFTAYFGSGKSRGIGGVLIIIGLIIGVLFLWSTHLLSFLPEPPIALMGCVTEAVAAVIGALIGALIALGLFLVAIMKA